MFSLVVLVDLLTGLEINSFNGGRWGNNSLHSINILLNKVIHMSPDVVLMMHNIQPVLITQASRLTDEPDEFVKQWTMKFEQNYGLVYSQFKALFDGFNEVIRDVGNAKDALVIDLERNIPKTSVNIFDLIHYTETGSQKAAEVIGRELLNSGFLFSDRMDS